MHGKDELCIKSSSTDSTPIKHEQEEDFVMETLEFTPFSSEEPAVKNDMVPRSAVSLMPVTCKQINDAFLQKHGDTLVINGVNSTNVKLVGRMIGISTFPGKGVFSIHDGTGILNGFIWLDLCPGTTSDFRQISEGEYAIVHGRVSMHHALPNIHAFSCRKVLDFNEITHHMLSAIAAHVSLTKNKEIKMDAPATPLTLLASMLECIKYACKDSSLKSVTVKDISSIMGISTGQISPLLAELLDAGEVYNTVDEEHFRPT